MLTLNTVVWDFKILQIKHSHMTFVHLRKSLCAYLYSKCIALVVSTGVWHFSLWRFFKWVNFPGRGGEQVSSCVSPHVGVGTEMPPVQLCSWSSLCGDLQIPPTKGSSCVERKMPIEQRWVSKPLTIKKLQEVSAKAIDRYHKWFTGEVVRKSPGDGW